MDLTFKLKLGNSNEEKYFLGRGPPTIGRKVMPRKVIVQTLDLGLNVKSLARSKFYFQPRMMERLDGLISTLQFGKECNENSGLTT